eukprot:UN23601
MGHDIHREERIRKMTLNNLLGATCKFKNVKDKEQLAENMLICCELEYDHDFICVLCNIVKIVREFNDKSKKQKIEEKVSWNEIMSLQTIPDTVSQCAEKHKIFKVMAKTYSNDQKDLLFHLEQNKVFKKFSSEGFLYNDDDFQNLIDEQSQNQSNNAFNIDRTKALMNCRPLIMNILKIEKIKTTDDIFENMQKVTNLKKKDE